MSGQVFGFSRPWIAVVAVPRWGLEYGEATFYGWWHCLHIGPLTIWWGRVKSEAEVCAKLGHDMHPRPTGGPIDRQPVACARCGFDPFLDPMIAALHADIRGREAVWMGDEEGRK